MKILRQKEFGVLRNLNQLLIKKYNPKAEKISVKEQDTSKNISDEIKSSVIYKLFPTIDTSQVDYIDPEKLKKFKTSGLKDKNYLMKCIEKLIWKYEEGVSHITGISEKDIKGNVYVSSLGKVLDNETVILNTGPKNNSILSRKISPDFFWDIMINLKTGDCDIWCAGD